MPCSDCECQSCVRSKTGQGKRTLGGCRVRTKDPCYSSPPATRASVHSRVSEGVERVRWSSLGTDLQKAYRLRVGCNRKNRGTSGYTSNWTVSTFCWRESAVSRERTVIFHEFLAKWDLLATNTFALTETKELQVTPTPRD